LKYNLMLGDVLKELKKSTTKMKRRSLHFDR